MSTEELLEKYTHIAPDLDMLTGPARVISAIAQEKGSKPENA